jgi:hypothetical protein
MSRDSLPPHDPITGEIIEEIDLDIEDIIGDILDDDIEIDISIEATEKTVEVEVEPAKTGEEIMRNTKKYLSLMEAFDIDAGNMEENMQKEKEKIVESLTPAHYKEEPQIVESIIDADDLISDFSLIRENLRQNIKSTSTILEKFGLDLASSHAEDVSGQMLMGYSELIKSANTSMKLLIDTYSTVSKTQVEIKKLLAVNKDLDVENGAADAQVVNNTINFTGTPAELLASLKEN